MVESGNILFSVTALLEEKPADASEVKLGSVRLFSSLGGSKCLFSFFD